MNTTAYDDPHVSQALYHNDKCHLCGKTKDKNKKNHCKCGEKNKYEQ